MSGTSAKDLARIIAPESCGSPDYYDAWRALNDEFDMWLAYHEGRTKNAVGSLIYQEVLRLMWGAYRRGIENATGFDDVVRRVNAMPHTHWNYMGTMEAEARREDHIRQELRDRSEVQRIRTNKKQVERNRKKRAVGAADSPRVPAEMGDS